MTGRSLAVVAMVGLMASAAAAQVTCRTNALGDEICVGVAPAERNPNPFPRSRFGLGAVQPRAGGETGPRLTPAGRTDILGNTFLTERDLPPDRLPRGIEGSRNCARDALGNLICR